MNPKECMFYLRNFFNIFEGFFIVYGIFILPSYATTSSIVFTLEVSHPRNLNKVELSFNEHSVNFFTNSSYYVRSEHNISTPSLGRFTTSMIPELEALKQQLKSYYKIIPLTTTNSRLQLHPVFIYLNSRRVARGDSHFTDLRVLLNNFINRSWTCVFCAIYTKGEDSIIRIVTRNGNSNITIFSKDDLECYSLDEETLECIDPQFGIFEI